MPVEDDDFYDLTNPPFPQRGDIFPGVPLLSLPPSKELVVLRAPGTRGYVRDLFAGQWEAIHEQGVDAFEGHPEYVVVSAQRGMAVLMTQTCDLVDTEHWVVCPAYTVEDADRRLDRGNLFAGKYSNLFGLPKHPEDYFPDSYIDLGDLRPVRKEALALSDRIATLTRAAENDLTDKLARLLCRRWGFAPGEEVRRGGKYRCDQCNKYFGISNPEREFKAGEQFPQCDNCRAIYKTAQWYPLAKYKKS